MDNTNPLLDGPDYLEHLSISIVHVDEPKGAVIKYTETDYQDTATAWTPITCTRGRDNLRAVYGDLHEMTPGQLKKEHPDIAAEILTTSTDL